MARICFDCGELHEGSDVVCEPCKIRLAQPEPQIGKPQLPYSSTLDTIVSAIMILVSLVIV